MDIFFYNTLTKKKELFKSLEPKKVKMYSCGPTVYKDATIGNMRTNLFQDTLRRVLEYNGYEVKQVMNITDVGHLVSDGDEEKFWKLLDERLDICYEALMCRHYALLGTPSDISPIHWQYGAIARLKKGEKIDKLLKDGYSTLSLGYIGIYETTKLMKGVTHTTPEGREFALKLMKKLMN